MGNIQFVSEITAILLNELSIFQKTIEGHMKSLLCTCNRTGQAF
ncbi:hypothetical protein SAMN04487969_11737 [Paenibacillus algorifonticola]|uniref:Uncharacterized protein n=1 Tax=Paenibacillus algorifonticola TaxID=684063 RepID=A0A1I2GQP8_9BACL|nr:hypothetical protein SAMN04487969_11737 [Paenibacillus algorifonticola]